MLAALPGLSWLPGPASDWRLATGDMRLLVTGYLSPLSAGVYTHRSCAIVRRLNSVTSWACGSGTSVVLRLVGLYNMGVIFVGFRDFRLEP
jgi:hypothetical protein